MNTYEKVFKACEYILERDKKLSSVNVYRSIELHIKVKEEFKEDFKDIADNTFFQYLSNSVRDTESRINTMGRRQGYYLVEIFENNNGKSNNIIPIENTNSSDDGTGNRNQRALKEPLLYPVLEAWLIGQEYQSDNISKGKVLGKWGNPDVAGIKPLDAFNAFSVEVITIEAKVSIDNWEQWIFEAISHRRFSNRVYFAFAHQNETINKIPKDMRYYAELYNIGVLVISVEDNNYKKLMDGNLVEPLSSDDVEIIELYSAPYNFVQPKYQLQFCKALDIKNIQELYHWGRKS